MELSEAELRHMTWAIVQIGFIGGLAGAVALHLMIVAITAVADRLAERTVRAMRIRAARQRSVEAP